MPRARYVNTGDDVIQDIARTEEWIAQGAPGMAELWERAQGTFTEPPMTVAQAAKRAGVSEKSIRRRLQIWSDLEPPAAWRVGRTWRISPGALKMMKVAPARPAAVRSKRRRRPQSGPDSELW